MHPYNLGFTMLSPRSYRIKEILGQSFRCPGGLDDHISTTLIGLVQLGNYKNPNKLLSESVRRNSFRRIS